MKKMRKIGNYKVAETDYKAGCEDVLYVLKETFGEEVSLLTSDEMQKLAEEYSQEQTEDAIKALGQEITTISYMLYSIEEDSDSFVLTIIPAESQDAFLQDMSDLKLKTKCMVQPRKKFGSPAKRMDFGERLKGTAIDIDGRQSIFPMEGAEDIYYARALPGDNGYGKTSVLYFDPQAVVIATYPKLINALAHKDGKYAVIGLNPKRESVSSGLTDKTSYIAVGEKLEDISEWKSIGNIEYDRSFVDRCIWFGEDLFLANAYKVYVIRKAMSDDPKIEMVYSIESHSSQTRFFIRKDSLYLLMNGKILRWNDKGFLKKAGFNKCIFEMKTSANGIAGIYAINEKEVAFVEPDAITKSDEVPMMDITVLNTETQKTRKIHTYRGWLFSVRSGELIVLCNGHDRVKDKKKFPLMTIIETESEKQKILPYGCLGSAEISSVYKTRNGELLLHTDKEILLPEDLKLLLKDE